MGHSYRRCLWLLLAAWPCLADQPQVLTFPARSAKFVRVAITATSGGEACLDELEVYGPDGATNLARGAKASASSCLPGYAIHQIAHLNDGLYGNPHSWIAAGTGREWAQLAWPAPVELAKVVVSRDRDGKFADRTPTAFVVQVSLDGQAWTTVAKVGAASDLPDPLTWDALLRYAFTCERHTWQRLDGRDHLSPLVTDRPASPGGPAYWGQLARLKPTERVLAQFADLCDRLAAKGLDVTAERAQLAALRARADDDERYFDARLAKRRLLLRDPDLAPLSRVLFVKRHPYLSSHNYSDVLDSQFKAGGGICKLTIPRRDGQLEPAEATLATLFDGTAGIARDPMADAAGQRVYFAYRPSKVASGSPFWHLYAVDAAGGAAKALTDGPFHDYYPCPLPDGGLAFISTRCRARFLCWRPQAFVLFRLGLDTGETQPLSYANLSEWSPSVMRDGRILWTRSEYQDKGADFGHTLWAVRPDGTHPELIFGNNTPNCYMNGREVPGSSELLCTLVSHGGDHNGPLGLIDTAKAPFDSAAVTNITPDSVPRYNMNWSRGECWRDPTPISRDYFLASHAPADRFGLYLADRWGNREILYLDPEIGSMTPTVLRAETPAPVLGPSIQRAPAGDTGVFTVADVYQGLGPRVARGRIKWLRVCQEVRANLEQLPTGEFRPDHGPVFEDFYASPTHKVRGPNGWPTYVAKAVLGLAPVEADGSARFEAPAGKVLYFEALDEHFTEIQRMRSVTQLQPGEQRGCIGCHEDRHTAPHPHQTQASVRPPSPLVPPPWGAGAFSYERVVQPVLDARCVRCHADAKLDLRGTLDGDKVPASYRTLIRGGWVHYFDMTYGLRHHKAEPLTFGTVKSRLWTVLDAGHHDVRLTADETQALKCWIDLNCPLWPDYQYRPLRVALNVR